MNTFKKGEKVKVKEEFWNWEDDYYGIPLDKDTIGIIHETAVEGSVLIDFGEEGIHEFCEEHLEKIEITNKKKG